MEASDLKCLVTGMNLPIYGDVEDLYCMQDPEKPYGCRCCGLPYRIARVVPGDLSSGFKVERWEKPDPSTLPDRTKYPYKIRRNGEPEYITSAEFVEMINRKVDEWEERNKHRLQEAYAELDSPDYVQKLADGVVESARVMTADLESLNKPEVDFGESQ